MIIKDNNIDIRRFITFGLEKRIIYRSYSYPVMLSVGPRETKETAPIIAKDSPNESNSSEKKYHEHSFSIIRSKNAVLFNNIKSGRPSKVSFDMQKASSLITGESTIPKLSDDEERILEESVRSAENFDKICVLLGKPKLEVENYLNELGEFKIINS